MLNRTVLKQLLSSRTLSSVQLQGFTQHVVSAVPTGNRTGFDNFTPACLLAATVTGSLDSSLSSIRDHARGLHGGSSSLESLSSGVTRGSGRGLQFGSVATVDPLPSSLAQELSDLLGDRFTDNTAACQAHGKDESYHDCIPPNAVAFPQSTEEVSEVRHT